jgi:hypothetical protein
MLNWLSDIKNRCWLLLFDNYDSSEQFDITDYYPLRFARLDYYHHSLSGTAQ